MRAVDFCERMETQALYEKYAEQIGKVEVKDLYENFLLLAIEMEEGDVENELKNITPERLRAEISRWAAAKVMSQFIEALDDKQTATFVFVRSFGVIIYLFALKGEEFLDYANSLPEYIFEICAEAEMRWKGEGEYGFFEFDQVELQKRIDEEVSAENADPLA